jgi:hypothetical protein
VRRNALEHLARDGVLAAKTDALIRLACAIDGAHRAVAQIQLKVERHGDSPNAHRTDDIAEAVDITRLFGRAPGMVVMDVNDLQPPGVAMLFADRVVNVEVDFSSLTTFLTLLNGEGDLRLKEFGADAPGAPRVTRRKSDQFEASVVSTNLRSKAVRVRSLSQTSKASQRSRKCWRCGSDRDSISGSRKAHSFGELCTIFVGIGRSSCLEQGKLESSSLLRRRPMREALADLARGQQIQIA